MNAMPNPLDRPSLTSKHLDALNGRIPMEQNMFEKILEILIQYDDENAFFDIWERFPNHTAAYLRKFETPLLEIDLSEEEINSNWEAFQERIQIGEV